MDTPATAGMDTLDTTATDAPEPKRRSLRWLLILPAILLLAGGVAAVAYAGTLEPTAARTLGGVLPVNPGATDPGDIRTHNSPTLIVNPTDPAQLAVTSRVAEPNFSCAMYASSNGGASWEEVTLPVPEDATVQCLDIDATFGADGTLYVAFTSVEKVGGFGFVPASLWVTTSDDGGATLSTPVEAYGPFAYQIRIAAHPEQADVVHLTWTEAKEAGSWGFSAPGNPILATRSDDGGETWEVPAQVNDPGHERAIVAVPIVSASGLYVVYVDLGDDRIDYEGAHEGQGGPPYPGAWQLVAARSFDQGKRWQWSEIDEIVPSERFLMLFPAFPEVALDEEGRIYAAYQDARSGDADIWMWSSSDGDRWSGATRINDNAAADGTSQYRPAVAAAPDGRLDVLYYDRRDDPDDVQTGVSFQSSFDQGASFEPAVAISDRPFDSSVGYGEDRGLVDPGTRLGLISGEGEALGVWADTRAAAEARVPKQDLARALVIPPQPPDLEGPLRYAGFGAASLGLLLLVGLVWSSRRRKVRRRVEEGEDSGN